VRRRAPCSGFFRGPQRTEAETKRGGMANTFQTRRVLVEEFGMTYWGLACLESYTDIDKCIGFDTLSA
jgi:hypothetical protein